jgi:hypothetical protein
MPAAISWSNYCDVLTKVVSFLDTLEQLLISFRPHDYNTHGYITLPAKDAKDYEVCRQRKILLDKFSWFGFERENRQRMHASFNYLDKAELPQKMQEMWTAISEVDLDTLHSKYPSYTFEKVKSTKIAALAELAKSLSNNVHGVVGGGGSFSAKGDNMFALLRELQMLT